MNNKRVIILTIFTILGMIVAPTIYKVYKEHQNNLVLVIEKEFIYQATLCYKENNCSQIVTLDDLYTKNYLEEKLTNPITKKYYSETSSLNLETLELELIS